MNPRAFASSEPWASSRVATPIGRLSLVASPAGLAAVLWECDGVNRVRLPALRESPEHAVLREVERQLGEYFAGGIETKRYLLAFEKERLAADLASAA